MATLLADIEAFLKAHDMPPTTFGNEARGDKHLVRQLRAGTRRMWPETEAAIRRFMATYPHHDAWIPTPRAPEQRVAA